MDVFLQLTSAGSDSGPFNLFTEEDGFLVPFETDVDKSILEAGAIFTTVPTYTNIVRIKSNGNCVNYVDIYLT